jgi:CRP/FNR family cyclic AMP-dependent transcriptional regulator
MTRDPSGVLGARPAWAYPMSSLKSRANAAPAAPSGVDAQARDPRRMADLPVGLMLSIPLFAALGPERAPQLAAEGTKRRYARGDTILLQGETCRSLFVLLDGRAHVLRADGQGREVILDVLRPGDHVGEMSLIDNLPHSATVRCDLPCDVLELDGTALARFLPGQPGLTLALLNGLVARLRRAHRQITSLALYDVPGRIARQLLDLAERQPDGRMVVSDRLSRSELARMVGASREMVSRVMMEFEHQGLLHARPDGSLVLTEHMGALD